MNSNNTKSPSRWKLNIPKPYKWILRGVLAFIVLILALYIGFAWYISSHKKEVLASVTETLNENLTGTIMIGDMEPALLQGFPLLSLNLKNVTISDSLYPKHKQLFLRAGNFDIAVNALALFRGSIEIRKIEINNAAIQLYTDTTGYSNSSVFKKSETKPDGTGGAFPELRKFKLDNVKFVVDNREKNKLFRFNIERLDGDIDYTSHGWNADIKLETLVHSMAFSTRKGSFIKGKIVEGKLKIVYDDEKDAINIKQSKLEIGGEDFTVAAQFRIERSSAYAIRIENDRILWRKASALLSPNISSRLDMFDFSEPISVSCDIVGDFTIKGDPLIHVKAKIKDNVLQSPGGTVTKCNFDGEFTNNLVKTNGYNDRNSAITFANFNGEFAEMPIVMKKASIVNLETPIASGDFSAEFDVSKMNNVIDKDLLAFTKGKAKVKLNYHADVENFILVKPIVEGTVDIKNADVRYTPRNLAFNDISVRLNFTDEDLFIKNIQLRSGKSIVAMDGEIKNFLNLIYTAPDKIVVDWKIHSPQLHLGEFIGFLAGRKGTAAKQKNTKGNFTKELNDFFEYINVNMALQVDKLYYNKFYANNAVAKISVNSSGINIENARISHAGGTIKLNGALIQKKASNRFNINATVKDVDISRFFDAFQNFGLESLRASNLKGKLSTTAKLSGNITESGGIIPRSMNGNVDFILENGQLLNFAPIKTVGNLAFPNRDFDNISLAPLRGRFDISGDKVAIKPMQVSSSVLNMDIEGTYAFGPGTEIYIAVPLRNPERDKDIVDAEELAKRRNRGIMLRLVAKDGKDGKVKIGLGRNKNGKDKEK